jgi:CheY-like chemotaxis protein
MMGLVRPTVLIVDDHEAFRDAARSLLETEGFEIVGEVAGGRDAPRRTPRLPPPCPCRAHLSPGMRGAPVQGLAGGGW